MRLRQRGASEGWGHNFLKIVTLLIDSIQTMKISSVILALVILTVQAVEKDVNKVSLFFGVNTQHQTHIIYCFTAVQFWNLSFEKAEVQADGSVFLPRKASSMVRLPEFRHDPFRELMFIALFDTQF